MQSADRSEDETVSAPVLREGLESLFARILPTFPELSEREQHIGIRLYKLLLKGVPVRREELATATGQPTRDVVRALDGGLKNLVLYDNERRLTGFGGLAVTPTPHRLVVNGRELFTWCAWDTLFIPELIGTKCVTRSRCPETHEPIQLTVAPDRIENVEPAETVMSFVIPDAGFCDCPTSEGIAGFCDHVHFLANQVAGEAFILQRPDVFLLSLEEAFALAKMLNAARYPAVAEMRNRE